MATKSILKNVVIKDKDSARRLVDALEQAKYKGGATSSSTVSYSYASSDELRVMFGGKNEGE